MSILPCGLYKNTVNFIKGIYLTFWLQPQLFSFGHYISGANNAMTFILTGCKHIYLKSSKQVRIFAECTSLLTYELLNFKNVFFENFLSKKKNRRIFLKKLTSGSPYGKKL